MKIMQLCTKRMNLNLSPKTYDALKTAALAEDRKPGSLARRILDRWVKENPCKKK